VHARSAGSDAAAFPLVLALHRRGAEARSALADARSRFGEGPDVIALQAARPCNPFQSNRRTESATPDAYAGFSWYLGDDPLAPEAASFGDALVQLDLFARSLRDAGECSPTRPFVITGEGQGAVLALALLVHAPAFLSAVHAVGGGMARIPGWREPGVPLDGRAVLIEDAATAGAADSGARAGHVTSAAMLRARGASVRICPVTTTSERTSWLRSQTAASRKPSRAH
jgi:hypothetical protein